MMNIFLLLGVQVPVLLALAEIQLREVLESTARLQKKLVNAPIFKV